MTKSPHESASALPAASVILVRESPSGLPGLEVFMARRHIKSDFAPDVYVFPGGKADAGDGQDGEHLRLGELPRLCDREAPQVGWRAIVMAAIRELFEETGLLLAQRQAEWVSADTSMSQSLEDYRDQVRAGTLTMTALAEREGLLFAGDHLRLFSNWITPEVLTRRFDTFFFAARLPHHSEVRLADAFELTDALWIEPANALTRAKTGMMPLVFATERHLQLLCQYDSANHFWDSTGSITVTPVSPRWYVKNSERVFVIPGDADYELGRTR
jgi:8-oxo-dGTP pyrophosphatase MutT (NUDIX family)